MAINFPNSPSAGDSHSEAGINWVYDGEKWVAQSEATFWARTNSTLSPSTAGDNISTTGDLTAGCTTTGTSGSSGEAKVVGYQQGSWTPVPTQGSCAISTAMWSRVGNLVTLQANLTAFTDTSTASNIEVEGIPYDRDSNMFPIGACRVSFLNYGEGNTIICNLTAQNRVRFQASRPSIGGTAATSPLDVQYTNFITASQANTAISLTISYLTDDTTWAPINGATIS